MPEFIHLQTISDIFKLFRLDDVVHHPLVAVIDFSKLAEPVSDGTKISSDHYSILFKGFKTSVKYGRKVVDFQAGSLICMAPHQVIEMDDDGESAEGMAGWGLFFHPDLIRGTALNEKMKEYSFFSYEISEALHLSEKEKQILFDCMIKIQTELQENIDVHSQAIIVSTIELLLNYCSRFYGRQFITRKSTNNHVIAQVEKILNAHFAQNPGTEKRLITVKDLAEQVHLSPGYLSDLLKRETGKNTQDLIHFHLIEEAKNILLSTNKSVSEIAYSLGFDYPQYFNKLFKQKTGKTPLEFRSMN
ncbi:helix-turn-helix domain-containing protein [Chitinophaga varians]|uniref:helix-turn-helix domain-containing protein n=1 Tax=Chitinophaga varians TaxID=2202339 RepID=UPI00165F6DF8|nr:AraC family transcriptional regulator [Chitinophaga varians]MBC9909385.1 helix-turn-helix transcriptional regulator [Chitinophaga varians]